MMRVELGETRTRDDILFCHVLPVQSIGFVERRPGWLAAGGPGRVHEMRVKRKMLRRAQALLQPKLDPTKLS